MIIISFGSNLPGPWGSPRETVQRAAKALEQQGIGIIRMSRLIETAPFGRENQPRFVNAAAVVTTHKGPEALMRALHMIERRAGRQRRLRWGPRTLDLDLLDYHGLVRRQPKRDIKPLVLPHPGILERRFVLEPISEVAPGWRHPVAHITALQALRRVAAD